MVSFVKNLALTAGATASFTSTARYRPARGRNPISRPPPTKSVPRSCALNAHSATAEC